jgi:hypothetical protein
VSKKLRKMTNLKDLKKVKTFNVEEFDGLKTKIASVVMTDIKIWEGTESRQLEITTEKVKSEKGIEIEVKEWINLKKDNESNEWGIPDNSDSNAMKFLTFFQVSNFEEVIGKDCMIVKKIRKDKSVLGIRYGQ